MTDKTAVPVWIESGRAGEARMSRFRYVGIAFCLLWGSSLLSGCVAQQADLKQVDRDLQKRIKQSTEELAQTRARQNQEIVTLKEQELPALRGELDRAQHRAQMLETRQEDLQAKLDSRLATQDSKLDKRIAESEKRAAERAAEETRRLGWAEQQLVNQERQMKSDRDQAKSEIAALSAGIDQLRGHIDAVQKNILEAVQKTNAALVQKVDGRLDEQNKAIAAVEHRQASIGQLDAQNKALTDQVGKLSQALAEFNQALNKVGERVVQQEQANKQLSGTIEQETTAAAKRTDALASRIDADNKATTEYLNKVNRSVESMHKALEQAGGKFVSRGDDQERRLDDLSKDVSHMHAQMQTFDKNMENQHNFLKQVEQHLQSLDKNAENQHTFLKQVEQHLQSLDKNYENHQVFLKQVEQHLAARPASVQRSESGVALAEAATPPAPSVPPVSVVEPVHQSASAANGGNPSSGNTRVAAAGDREAYERILNRFKEGDLDSARQGFAEFLVQHPHSDFAPNARFWLGESYYGKKDYPKAIDAYDQVQLNYPTSDKVPAALLKKGYAYLALKDRKRAASTLKQVIDLYPRSPEANKAVDKLNQLKELH
jgi:tol-pal system protein YbgF